MKLLKVEGKQGYFLVDGDSYFTVDKITKEHLLRLVDLTLSESDVEFDEYSEEFIMNQAHQIVYQSVYQKLISLYEKRQEFVDDMETLYLNEYQKYKEDLDGTEQ